jgi:hypothetical protein
LLILFQLAFPFQDKTPEAKKCRKEENGGGGDPERVGEFPEEDEEPEIEDEDDEEDIGEGEEDELEGEGMSNRFDSIVFPLKPTFSISDEELEEEDIGAEEEDDDA